MYRKRLSIYKTWKRGAAAERFTVADFALPFTVSVCMLKFNSLNFEHKCFVCARLEANAFVSHKTDITHGENPTLRLENCLPRLLVERYY